MDLLLMVELKYAYNLLIIQAGVKHSINWHWFYNTIHYLISKVPLMAVLTTRAKNPLPQDVNEPE